MRRKIYIVICGAIREPVELSLVLAELLDFRQQGLIDKIRISTWLGEFDQCKYFRNRLIELGIEIVESSQASEAGLANTWRQYLAFDQGILDLDDQTLVVKARTDKMSTYLPWIKVALETKLHLFEKNIKNISIFERKVLVPYFSLSMPFLIKDVSFIGLKKDLKKFCHFEYWSQIRSVSSVTPEGRWKAFPFLSEFPVFKELFAQADMLKLSTWVVDNCRAVKFPSSLIKIYALYFAIVSNCFEAFYSNRVVERKLSFAEILSGQIGRPVEVERMDWSYCYTTSNSVFDNLSDANPVGPNDIEFFQQFSNQEKIFSAEFQQSIDLNEVAMFFVNQGLAIFDYEKATKISTSAIDRIVGLKSTKEHFRDILTSLGLGVDLINSIEALVERDSGQGDFLTSLLFMIDRSIETGNIREARIISDFTFSLAEARIGSRPLEFLLTRFPKLNGRQELFPSVPELYNQTIDSDVFVLSLLTLWKNYFGESGLLSLVQSSDICPISIRKGVAKFINPS